MQTEAKKDKSRTNYCNIIHNKHMFPDQSFLDLVDFDETEDVVQTVEKMVQHAAEFGMESSDTANPRRLLSNYV